MEKTYTTEEMVKRVRRLKKLALGLIFLGMMIVFISLFGKHGGTFQLIGQMLDDLFVLGTGFYLLMRSNKRLKKIEKESLFFNEDGVVIRLNEKEIKLDKSNKPKAITIKLKTINIITHDGQEIVVNLDDYSTNTMIRKEIKKQFDDLKEKFTVA